MTEQDVRNAAENLLRSNEFYNSQNIQSPADISHSHSINTLGSVRPEYVISADLFAGRMENGRMSSVRRFFCLFVTFDLLFTVLMWIICIMLTGENIFSALSKQIVHYDVHTSLFDVVLLSICRFIILLFFYALLYIHNWSVIAISTASTCALLIGKVFVYDWQASNQPVFQVLLILISFVLSWGEAWFLDYRVIPQEYNARQFLIPSPESERAPLIRSYVQGLPSMYTESIGNFYSPLGSREGSPHPFDVAVERFPSVKLSSSETEEYKILSSKILTEAWTLLNSSEWKEVKENDNVVIESMTMPKNGKIFKLTGDVQISPKHLLDELFYRVEHIPSWNPALLESHIVQYIDEHTDISYQISSNGAAGAVTSRDFVNLRHWGQVQGCYVIAWIATEHVSVPKNDKYIRGENRVSCLVMRPIAGDSERCTLHWVLNISMKGWIPQYILDAAYVNMMFDYIKNLNKYVSKLRQSGCITKLH